MFKSYTKIDTVFKRDIEGTKKLVLNDYRSEEVKLLKDLPWEFSEKIDGTNTLVMWDGHKVSFGGRTERAQIPNNLMKYLEETFGGEVNEELFEQKFGEKEVILYGEGYGEKIQNGGGYRKGNAFILFDVLIDGVWLKREAVEDIARLFNIEIVPIILTGTIDEAIEIVKSHPKSWIAKEHGGDAFAEGLVGRAPLGLLDRMGRRLIVKIKWDDFKEFV